MAAWISTPSKPAARAFRAAWAKSSDDAGQFVSAQFARLSERHAAGWQEEFPRDGDRRGRDGSLAAQDVGMRGAAGMPDLVDDPAARLVHGGGDLAPFGDLRVVVDARRAYDAMGVFRDLGALVTISPASARWT